MQPKRGARRYAWPERHKYPLDERQEVHAAIAHFDAHKSAYPAAVRAAVGRRIAARARELGIATPSLSRGGGDPVAKRKRSAAKPKAKRSGGKRKRTLPEALRRHQFKKGHKPWNKGR